MKTIQKSIRMTEEIHNYVEKFSGKGFNEKFENLVLFFMKREKELDKRIAEQEKTLETNGKRIQLQRNVLADFESISRSVKSLLDVTKAAEVSAKEIQLKMRADEETPPSAAPKNDKETKEDIELFSHKECNICAFCNKVGEKYYCNEEEEIMSDYNNKAYFHKKCEHFKLSINAVLVEKKRAV